MQRFGQVKRCELKWRAYNLRKAGKGRKKSGRDIALTVNRVEDKDEAKTRRPWVVFEHPGELDCEL